MVTRLRALTLIAGSIPLTACPSQEPPRPHPVIAQAQDAWVAFNSQYPRSEMAWDSLTGVAGEVRLFHSRPYAGSDGRTRARGFLAEHRLLFGLDSALSQLQYDTTNATRAEGRTGIQYVRFHQVLGDVPVYGTETLVHLTDSGRVFRVYNRFFPGLAIDTARRISQREAIAIADRDTPANPHPRIDTQARIVVYPRPPGSGYAWRVQLGVWEVLVDARSGRVLSATEQVRRQSGRVFTQNKCDTPTRIDDVLTNLDGSGFLRGPFFDVVGASGRVQETSLSFVFTEAQEGRLAQTEVYYQLERANAFFAAFGFVPAPAPMSATANIGEACNAFFSPGGNFFEFGRSADPWWPWSRHCFNPGWDGDVIVHEYTHKVIDQIATLGFTLDPASVHEGVADYFSSSFFGEGCLGETIVNRNCNSCLRNVDNDIRFRNALDEAHSRGRVLAGALWDIRTTLGAGFADAAASGAIGGIPTDADFTDFALSTIDAGVALFGDLDSFLEVFAALISIQAMVDAFCAHGIRLPDAIGRCPYIDWWEDFDFRGRFHTRTLYAADGGDCLKLENNDAMKSIKFYGMPGWRLRIYDSPSCSTSDDWGELIFPGTYGAVVELPRIGNNGPGLVSPPGAYVFHYHNGLPGKVSAIRHLP
jgi:hypothetical protein